MEPLVEKTLSPPVTGGLHGLSLAELGVSLAPGVTYQWSVAMVVDEAQRSKDILSGGAVQFTPEADPAQLPEAATDRAIALAAQGCWYDAFDEIGRAHV